MCLAVAMSVSSDNQPSSGPQQEHWEMSCLGHAECAFVYVFVCMCVSILSVLMVTAPSVEDC